MESIGLQVKKPMYLYVDNKGTVDLTRNWSVGGQTRHIKVKQYYLRKLKEEGIMTTVWINGDEMTSDALMKNLGWSLFEKHNMPQSD